MLAQGKNSSAAGKWASIFSIRRPSGSGERGGGERDRNKGGQRACV